ncbi:hypothetical protein E2C01_073092 [Portunus trituberculatus]|uniref:Uncharacterized protein n=1 Tax=Portunus trituberculatus TaxID=210409 RepID=A0A5B7I1W4_PORTR|nr:hypothetical protein [Portunus trituberculatus]
MSVWNVAVASLQCAQPEQCIRSVCSKRPDKSCATLLEHVQSRVTLGDRVIIFLSREGRVSGVSLSNTVNERRRRRMKERRVWVGRGVGD